MAHSDSKPTDGRYTRKGERDGPRLTPGERAKNWAQAAVTAWPIVLPLLGLLGYTNADEISRFINGKDTLPVPTGEVVTPTETTVDAWRAQAAQSLASMKAAIDSQKAQIVILQEDLRQMEKRLENGRVRGDEKILERLAAIDELVN